MTSQKISDILLGDSCNSDSDVALFIKPPKKRSQKRVVKTGISLFFPADFLKNDRLIAAVERTNVTQADL